jgi:hypothetical protein
VILLGLLISLFFRFLQFDVWGLPFLMLLSPPSAAGNTLTNYALAFVLGIFGLVLVWKLIKNGLKFVFYGILLVIIVIAIINLV